MRQKASVRFKRVILSVTMAAVMLVSSTAILIHAENDDAVHTAAESTEKKEIEYRFFAIDTGTGRKQMNIELQMYIQEVLDSFGILPYWPTFYCQIFQESSFREDAVSEWGDYGLCQLNGRYHEYFKEISGLPEETDLKTDTLANLYAGSYLMSVYLDRWQTEDLAMSFYNTGNSRYNAGYVANVRQWEQYRVEITAEVEDGKEE